MYVVHSDTATRVRPAYVIHYLDTGHKI